MIGKYIGLKRNKSVTRCIPTAKANAMDIAINIVINIFRLKINLISKYTAAGKKAE